jgi:hypothetical protein
MKKLIVLTAFLTLLFTGIVSAAENDYGSNGPAPNAGDCIPDGSGLAIPNGPNGDGTYESDNGPMGAAPNSGDGIPDGSGFETPNGPNNE